MSRNYTVLSSYGCISTCEDNLNTSYCRNLMTEELLDFNCAGYALETFTWFCPLACQTDIIAKKVIEDGYDIRDIDIYDLDPISYKFEINHELKKIYKDAKKINQVYHLKRTKDEIEDEVKAHFYENDSYNSELILYICVQNMLDFFPDLRLINNTKEIEDDEYGIVFAIGNGDFHFAKIDNGIISHKPGGGTIRQVSKIEDAFSKRYYSEKIYFAKKKITS